MTYQELETGEELDELSEGYNDYLETFDSDRPEYDKPLTFREWCSEWVDEQFDNPMEQVDSLVNEARSIAEKQMERAEQIRDERREDGISD